MKAKGKSLKEPKHRNQTVLMGVKFRKLFTLQAPMITVSARYSEITQSAIAFDLINAFYKKKKKILGQMFHLAKALRNGDSKPQQSLVCYPTFRKKKAPHTEVW